MSMRNERAVENSKRESYLSMENPLKYIVSLLIAVAITTPLTLPLYHSILTEENSAWRIWESISVFILGGEIGFRARVWISRKL